MASPTITQPTPGPPRALDPEPDPTTSARSRTAVRIEGACLVAVAAAAALVTATVDAASIAVRLGGERLAERPSWLVGFAVSLFTATLGLWIFEDGPRLRRSVVALCVVLAVANVAVAITQLVLTSAAWVLPALHLIAAAVLVALAAHHDRARDAHERRGAVSS